MKILFSDEKLFDIDGVYNVQNDRIWDVDCGEADKNGGKKQKRKFPQKVMVWYGLVFAQTVPHHWLFYTNVPPIMRDTGGGKIIGTPLVNAKKLTFYFKKRSVRLVNIFDRNIDICDILVCLYSLFSSFKCM